MQLSHGMCSPHRRAKQRDILLYMVNCMIYYTYTIQTLTESSVSAVYLSLLIFSLFFPSVSNQTRPNIKCQKKSEDTIYFFVC